MCIRDRSRGGTSRASIVGRPAASRCCNECRTRWLGSYSNSLDDPSSRRHAGSCTGYPDRLQSGPADVQGLQHVDAVVPSTPDQGAGTCPQPTIHHHVAVSTIVNDNICKAHFSLHSALNLELATEDSD